MFNVEDGRWMVALGGYLGEHAPTDEGGFLEFVRSLPAPDIYDTIKDSEPPGEPAHDVRDTPVHPRRRQTAVRSVAGRCLMAEAWPAPGRA